MADLNFLDDYDCKARVGCNFQKNWGEANMHHWPVRVIQDHPIISQGICILHVYTNIVCFHLNIIPHAPVFCCASTNNSIFFRLISFLNYKMLVRHSVHILETVYLRFALMSFSTMYLSIFVQIVCCH